MDEYIIQTDTFDFEERLSHPCVLAYFYDHRNLQCRGFSQIMEEVAEQRFEDVLVLSVDMEQSPELAARYGVESVPCVILFLDGNPVADLEGANLPSVYYEMIDSYQ